MASKKVYVDLDLNLNHLLQANLENIARADFPSAAASQKGRIIFDTTNNVPVFCDGSAWNPMTIKSVTTSGSGNVVTAVAYNTTTGVLTVTKGLTAEANQNAFSNVKNGTTTITAGSKTDTLEIAAGSNVTITPDATNKKITIASSFENTKVTNASNHYTPTGTSVPTLNTATTPTSDTVEVVSQVKGDAKGHIVSQDRVNVVSKKYVDEQIAALGNALNFKGTIGTGTASATHVTSLPATHKVGDTYLVKTAGSYAGQTCEIGDMIVCVTAGTTANNAHWQVIQGNWTAVAGTSALDWNSEKTLATIGGVEIKAKMPARPSVQVSYDATNKKITKNIDGTASDVVTAAKIVTDGGGITSHQSLNGYVNAIEVTGSGNAITSATKSGEKITFAKEVSFPKYYKSAVLTGTTGSVQAATHGCGVLPQVRVYKSGEEIMLAININSTGTISWESNVAFTDSDDVRMVVVGI